MPSIYQAVSIIASHVEYPIHGLASPARVPGRPPAQAQASVSTLSLFFFVRIFLTVLAAVKQLPETSISDFSRKKMLFRKDSIIDFYLKIYFEPKSESLPLDSYSGMA